MDALPNTTTDLFELRTLNFMASPTPLSTRPWLLLTPNWISIRLKHVHFTAIKYVIFIVGVNGYDQMMAGDCVRLKMCQNRRDKVEGYIKSDISPDSVGVFCGVFTTEPSYWFNTDQSEKKAEVGD